MSPGAIRRAWKPGCGLREYLAWPTELLHVVPDAFSDTDAAMLEPLGVALHAVDLARPRLGSTVTFVGCGPIGLCAVQLARAAGAVWVVRGAAT